MINNIHIVLVFWFHFLPGFRIPQPDVPSIKKRIEDLIDREYMKRDDKNPNIYIYVGSWAEPEDTNERGQTDELLKK